MFSVETRSFPWRGIDNHDNFLTHISCLDFYAASFQIHFCLENLATAVATSHFVLSLPKQTVKGHPQMCSD